MADSKAFQEINYLRSELAGLVAVVDDDNAPAQADAIEFVAGLAAQLNEFMATHFGDGDDGAAS